MAYKLLFAWYKENRARHKCLTIITLRLIMKKNVCLSLALTICMGVTSAPLLAEDLSTSVNIAAPDESAASHTEAAAHHKEQAAHHKAMVEHYKALVAAEYEKGGHTALTKQHEAMAAHHEALSNEHQKAAAIHETMVKPK